MDETVMQELVDACAGMTEDEILSDLVESGLFGQPELVAAFLAHRATGA